MAAGRRTVSVKGVAPSRSTTLLWMAPYPIVHEQHKLDSEVIKTKQRYEVGSIDLESIKRIKEVNMIKIYLTLFSNFSNKKLNIYKLSFTWENIHTL